LFAVNSLIEGGKIPTKSAVARNELWSEAPYNYTLRNKAFSHEVFNQVDEQFQHACVIKKYHGWHVNNSQDFVTQYKGLFKVCLYRTRPRFGGVREGMAK